MLCIIQARASSVRLKRKIFQLIEDKTILEHVINNVKSANSIKNIIIATSKNEDDNETCELCNKLNIEFFRGDLKNVASRFYEIIMIHQAEKFMRINADSPLIDPSLIDQFVNYYDLGLNDIITNVLKRSFPKGQSIEIFNSKIFIDGYNKFSNYDQKENVTKYFYENNLNYKILNIENKLSYSDINLSVDTLEDLKKLRQIYKFNKNINWLSYTLKYKKLFNEKKT